MCISIQFIVSTINVQALKRIHHYLSHSIKQINQTRNIKQVRNSLSKMKESYQLVLKKGLFAPIKGILYLPKGHLENPKCDWRSNFPLIRRFFSLLIQIMKNCYSFLFFFFFFFFFFLYKKGTFAEASTSDALFF